MSQQSFTDIEYANRRRKIKREKFLESMDQIIPWDYWVDMIRPYYPSGKRGRPPRGIETMLRMYLLQIWFNLSDEGSITYPCETSSAVRLKNWFPLLRIYWERALTAIQQLRKNVTLLVAGFAAFLPIKPSRFKAGWLKKIVRIFVNAGFWIQA